MNQQKGLFNIGDKIELIREESKDIKLYPSQILDITKNNIYIVSGPIYKNKIVPLHINEKIGIAYLVENRGRYIFNAKVIKRDYKRVYKLEIEKISEIIKYQQREYYRFETSIIVTKEMNLKTKTGEETLSEVCRTKNISGNGMQLLSNFEHKIGDRIKCKFKIKTYPIDVECEVVRIEAIDSFDYNYGLGIKFLDINERDRDIIIKYIFEEERLLRGKG